MGELINESNSFLEANKYLANGLYEKAIKLYEKFINDNINNDRLKDVGRAYHNMGVAYDNQKKYDLAMECFNKALECHSKNNNFKGMSWAYFSMGLVYGTLNKFQDMVESTKKAIDFGSKVEDLEIIIKSCNSIAHAFTQLNEYSESIKYLDQALEIEKELEDSFYLSESYYLKGIVLEKLNLKKEAKDCFELAVEEGVKAQNEKIVTLALSILSEIQA